MKFIPIMILLLLLVSAAQAQRTQLFSFSPMTNETARVNGVVVGIGHFGENKTVQRINGLNLDLFIFSPLILMHTRSTAPVYEETKLISNGLNVAVGGFARGGVVHNGVSFGLYNFGNAFNGFAVHATFMSVPRLNGLSVALFGNHATYANGLQIGINNDNQVMNGIQLGIVNQSFRVRGLQLGIYNESHAVMGVQVGLWNKNAKRSLPFLNF